MNSPFAHEIEALLRKGRPAQVGARLGSRLTAEGLRRFAEHTLPEINERVGTAWSCSELAVHQEHIYTEQAQIVMRAALANLALGGPPVVMLTTLPGELHTLGLLAVEALLSIGGAEVLPYGAQMPPSEIVAAAVTQRVDVVGLSFAAGFSADAALQVLTSLRRELPPAVEIWVGGHGAPASDRLQGLARAPGLAGIAAALADWRRRHLA